MKMDSLSTPFRGWKRKAVVLLLQLAPATWALVYPRVADINPATIDKYDGPAGNHSKTLLSARQDASMGEGSPMGLDCMYRCTFATCGAGSCPLKGRGLRYPEIEARTEGNVTSSLRKRVFTKDEEVWTAQEIDRYVWNNLGYSVTDTQFQQLGAYDRLINEFAGEVTVAAQRVMPAADKKAFQIGTNHVHGCTVVIIVSNRAVWMAHFWEGTMDPDTEGHETFRQKVIYSITHDEDMDGMGDYLTPKWYNEPTDQTRVIIYTPLRADWASVEGGGLGEDTWLYKKRVLEIMAAIEQMIGRPKIEVIPYFRLNYSPSVTFPDGLLTYHYFGPDAHLVPNNARGCVLFQYDFPFIYKPPG
ncbi:hypothetical protein B0T21DRAFT_171280 [Apiosordaria backusii]|uniref:DUF3298 domain-containing protein n=1 Tax=Apiosordaria backusii TaxID=314023 RepID=A0AA40BKL5_9PEZI|nr:hypothetical protein B0T21DRAFT_171280 [Apiosordaria backusii]